jgi:hypothetical protein
VAGFVSTVNEKRLQTPLPTDSEWKNLVFITGVALFEVETNYEDWYGEHIDDDKFLVGPKWAPGITSDDVVAVLALASISGNDSDYDGWAVNGWDVAIVDDPDDPGLQRIKLVVDVAVKGLEGSQLNRLSYAVTARGNVEVI